MRTVNWFVPDYHCQHCLSRITEALRDLKGVHLLRGDPSTHILTLEGNNPEVLAYAKHRLAQAGYPVQPVKPQVRQDGNDVRSRCKNQQQDRCTDYD